jgi:hypothetical protein
MISRMFFPSVLLALAGLAILIATLRMDDPSGDLKPWVVLGALLLGCGVLLAGLWLCFFRE